MNHSFNVEIAKKYGVDGAIMIENLYFWIQKNKVNNKNFHDGRYWTYNSMKAFTELFPYWTEKQIRRILENLKKDGAIITGNYNKIPYDRTLWYALDDSIISFYSNETLDLTKQENGKPKKVEPIPDINTDINTDIIISGTENHEQQNNILSKELLQRIIDKWNTVSTNKIKGIKPNTQRYSMLKERLKEYGENSVIEAIDNVGKSSFLKGRNNRNWTIDFDWFVRPNNFPKVLEGRYADKTTVTPNKVESTTDNEGGDWIGNM